MSKKLTIATLLGATTLTGALMVTTLAPTSKATEKPNNTSIATLASDATSSLTDETVYVFTDNAGSVKKTISSDWSKNLLDNTDFYSKTDALAETPITLKISYTLDGRPISGAELAGKSGKVTIRFDYENHARSGGYYVPYAVLTGLALDNANFSNISASNGKILNDGNRTIIAGVALPGMQENLGLSSSDISIPDYLEITADAHDFKLGTTMSLVSSKLFSELDIDGLDGTIQSLSYELNKLNSAMDQLISGATSLTNGLATLNAKTTELANGLSQLSAGAKQLSSGAKQLDAGVSQLQTGVESLYAGVNTNLVSKNASLQNSAKAIYESALAQANGDESQVESIYQFYQGVVAYTNSVAQINEGVVKGQILAGITKEGGLKAGSSALSEGTSTISDGLALIDSKMPELGSGVSQLQDGSTKLKDGLVTFDEQGVQKLVNFYNGEVASLTSRIRTIVSISKAQKPTKYLYRTDEI